MTDYQHFQKFLDLQIDLYATELARLDLIAKQDQARYELGRARADDMRDAYRALIDDLQRQLIDVTSRHNALYRKVEAFHAPAIEQSITVISRTVRNNKIVAQQVVIRIGRHSWTRHLRIENGKWRGRPIGLPMDMFVEYHTSAWDAQAQAA